MPFIFRTPRAPSTKPWVNASAEMARTITILIWGKPIAALTRPRQQKKAARRTSWKALASRQPGKSAILSKYCRRANALTHTDARQRLPRTQQVASGITVQVFTTGRGTPYVMAVPVIKCRRRKIELANRWYDLMDINAGNPSPHG